MARQTERVTAADDHGDRTRRAYDATVDVYVERIGGEIVLGVEQQPELDLLDAFTAGLAPGSLVADLGCGPGRMCAHLGRRGLAVVGVDLSAGMLDAARRLHPSIAVAQSDLRALPLRDTAVDAAVLWYSIIHLPAVELTSVFVEVRRILRTGAPVLLGFQSGHGEVVHRDEIAGRPVSMTNVRHSPSVVEGALVSAGFTVESVTTRDAVPPLESTPQTFVVARP